MKVRSPLLKAVIICFICVLPIVLVSHVIGATYYIDSTTGLDTNTSVQAQNQSTPWAHMPGMSGCSGNCASYSVQAGDVFVLKGGSTWTFASTTADLITIGVSGITIQGGQRLGSPWGSGYPVIDGSTATVNRVGIAGKNKSVTVDGIKLVNIGNPSNSSGGWGTFLSGGGTIEIKNCWFETSAIDAIVVTMGSGNVSHLWIHDNHFKNNGRVEIGQGSGDSAYSIDDIRIYNNLFEGPGQVNYSPYHLDGFMIQSNNKTAYGITNLKIYNNIFYGDWRQGGTAAIFLSGCNFSGGVCQGDNGPYSTQHTEIYNNVVSFENNLWANFLGGILTTVTGPNISPALIDIQAGQHEDIKIYNNTVSSSATTVAVSSCIFAGSKINGLLIKNNIVSGCDNGITLGQGITGTLEVDYNLYNATIRYINGWPGSGSVDCRNITNCGKPPFTEVHGKSGDPLFIALPWGGVVGSGNWRVKASSPAIGNGINLNSYFTTDIDGQPRGSSWDIGAYQDTESSLALPANLRIIQ